MLKSPVFSSQLITSSTQLIDILKLWLL